MHIHLACDASKRLAMVQSVIFGPWAWCCTRCSVGSIRWVRTLWTARARATLVTAGFILLLRLDA
eukprot:SAG31_NODE_34648_length_331_cov_0.448276_2_plen_64_part_01